MNWKMWEFKDNDYREVREFINRFTLFNGEVKSEVISTFTGGCCYWFAWILHQRFPQSKIMYNHVVGHFACRIGDKLFDITGEIPRDKNYAYWDRWETDEMGFHSGEKQRIIRNCIMLKE